MEDEEPPATERSTNAGVRSAQACQRCRALKTRCIPSPQAGTCQRCYSSKRECGWADVPRRPRRARGPSRISQIEQKIDGLVAGLGVSDLRTGSQHTQSRGRETSSAVPSQRPVAPGSWLPFPASFEQEPPEPVDDALDENRLPQHDTEPTQQFLEHLRGIHSFEDTGTPAHLPSSSLESRRRADPGIKSERVDTLITSGEADRLVEVYRAMCASFPFVPLPVEASAYKLSTEKPMLFLAIITVASWKDHRLQQDLDQLFRTELAHRTIIRPRKTLSLLQSIVVYLSRYHFVFSHKTQQIYSLLSLAVGMAIDVGLHQKSQRPLVEIPGRPPPPAISAEEQRERQRTLLGCYFLSSTVGSGLQKPNLLKYSDYMAECGRNLKKSPEYPSDCIISQLISLSHFSDQIQSTFFTEETIDLPLEDTRILMNFRFTESQLEEKRNEACPADFQHVVDMSFAFTDMQLHSIALRPTSFSSSGSDSTRLTALVATLEACKRYMDTLLALPAYEYHLISFAEWMRLPCVIMTVARLCIPNPSLSEAQWDVKMAHDRARLDLYLDSLCYRMQSLTAYDGSDQRYFDFWFAMKMIMELTRSWYNRKTKANASTSTSTSALPTPDTMNSGSGDSGEQLIADQSSETFGTSATLSSLDMGGNDPFAFMKSADFEMDTLLDVDNLWGDYGYTSLGFGNGPHF